MNQGTRVYLLLDRSILRAAVEGTTPRLDKVRCRPDGWDRPCDFLRVGEVYPRTDEGLRRIRESIEYDNRDRLRRLDEMAKEDSELRELAG
jgi:DNA primase large subunit